MSSDNNLSERPAHSDIDYEPINATPATWRVGFKPFLLIIGSIIGAVAAAILHHFFDAYLDGKEVTGFWNQSRTRRFENAIATVVKLLLSLSAGTSLYQVAWHRARHVSFQISDLDALLSAPSVLSIFYPNLIVQAPIAIAIVTAITASPVIPVLAPSLTVRLGNPNVRSITVPTLDLVGDRDIGAAVLNSWTMGYYVQISEIWEKTAIQALMSSTAIHWPIPGQCAPSCQYNVTYSATALRCSDLDPRLISNGVPSNSTIQDPPDAYLDCYDYACLLVRPGYVGAILNFTAQQRSGFNVSANMSVAERDHYGITLTYLDDKVIDGPSGTARGSNCTFYNATYMAHVLFVNDTQVNDIHILEYHNPLNTSYKFYEYTRYDDMSHDTTVESSDVPDAEQNLNVLAMADSFITHLLGSISVPTSTNIPNITNTLIAETTLFNLVIGGMPDDSTSNSVSLNTVTNISQSLMDLMANMTLNFMNIDGIGNTSILANVPSTINVYKYHRPSLLLTYVIAISVMSAAAVMGLTSLMSNGVESSNTFSQIMVTTRNPRLDSVAYGACLGSTAVQNTSLYDIRLRFGKIKSSMGAYGEHAGFGVVAEEEVGLLKKGDVVY